MNYRAGLPLKENRKIIYIMIGNLGDRGLILNNETRQKKKDNKRIMKPNGIRQALMRDETK